ncbi:unnamed protein product [Ranitomeya imitator]|uniref:dolichyl-diphosphooligosaccharide--protein glycotransferase n=1 Tax=Ranitomeya imitator TaxID=111125 RepID=A0ABN9MI66_9NEOB|nr:unnamed protein product [Ranitomeya imitator]
MFTLVTGIVGRWRAVCVTAPQRTNSDAAAIRRRGMFKSGRHCEIFQFNSNLPERGLKNKLPAQSFCWLLFLLSPVLQRASFVFFWEVKSTKQIVYPGLMVTAGLIHWVLNMLNITVHIRDVCVFLAPVFSGLTSISTFLLTRELWNQGAGLLAACFIAIVPGYISRSVAGSFDNEGIAIFALQFTYYLWVYIVM